MQTTSSNFSNLFVGFIISAQGFMVYDLRMSVDKLTLKVAEQEATILFLTKVADSAKKEKASLVAAFDPFLAVALVSIIGVGLVVLYLYFPSQVGVEACQLLNTGAAESAISLTRSVGQMTAVQTSFIEELVSRVVTQQYVTLSKIGDLTDKVMSVERAIRGLSPTISHVGSEVGTRLIENQDAHDLVMSAFVTFGAQ